MVYVRWMYSDGVCRDGVLLMVVMMNAVKMVRGGCDLGGRIHILRHDVTEGKLSLALPLPSAPLKLT